MPLSVFVRGIMPGQSAHKACGETACSACSQRSGTVKLQQYDAEALVLANVFCYHRRQHKRGYGQPCVVRPISNGAL